MGENGLITAIGSRMIEAAFFKAKRKGAPYKRRVSAIADRGDSGG